MSEKIEDGGPAFPADWVDFQPTTGEQVVREQFFGMTLRQHAAITLRVPQSGLPWLDEMIEQARRDAFAGQALAGLVSESGRYESKGAAEDAYRFADAIIESGRVK